LAHASGCRQQFFTNLGAHGLTLKKLAARPYDAFKRRFVSILIGAPQPTRNRRRPARPGCEP